MAMVFNDTNLIYGPYISDSSIYGKYSTAGSLYNNVTTNSASTFDCTATTASSTDTIDSWKYLSDQTNSLKIYPTGNYTLPIAELKYEIYPPSLDNEETNCTSTYRFINTDNFRCTDDNIFYTPAFGTNLCNTVFNPISEKDRKRNKIKSNLTIHVINRGNHIGKVSDAEWIALQTLREMISESDYRKYLKYGFISVIGESGKIYQVFRNQSHTKVFLNGILVEEICVRISDRNIPPTDNVIAFKTIIETDEESFASMGNRYKMTRMAA